VCEQSFFFSLQFKTVPWPAGTTRRVLETGVCVVVRKKELVMFLLDSYIILVIISYNISIVTTNKIMSHREMPTF